MKLLFVLVFCLVSLASHAQSAFSGNSVTVGNTTFICKQAQRPIIKIFHHQSSFNTGSIPNLPPTLPNCRHGYIEGKTIKGYIFAVFNASRRAELANERLQIAVYINRDTGVTSEVYYYVSKTTLITPQEIAQLETLLKQNVHIQAEKMCPNIDVGIVISNHNIWFSEL
ncbi:MAG: hypothetical protein EAZ95_14495 [Bacteroidetes bacterium]|nr:MAG: hypothetical protein EAZ95_14495 [Bacteroidota bacterium]